MVLRPGDSLPEDSCERVGNFPHGLLTNPDSLRLKPDAFGKTTARNLRKEAYIEAFSAEDLKVCNEDQFAKLHSPYILNLQRETDKPPDEDPNRGGNWYVSIGDAVGFYNVSTYGPLGYTGDKWEYRLGQTFGTYPAPLPIRYKNDASSGSVTFDIFNGPGLIYWTDPSYDGGVYAGSFYRNKYFLCTAEVTYNAQRWNTPNTEDPDTWKTITATCVFTYANDNSTLSYIQTKSYSSRYSAGVLLTTGTRQESVPWINEQGRAGSLSKTGSFAVRVEILWKQDNYENILFD